MKRSFAVLSFLLLCGPWAEARETRVEVFLTSWCSYCRRLENFLKQSGIDYVRYDVEKDAEGARLYGALGSAGVPVTRVGGDEIIYGYDPARILASLRSHDR